MQVMQLNMNENEINSSNNNANAKESNSNNYSNQSNIITNGSAKQQPEMVVPKQDNNITSKTNDKSK